MAATVNVQYWNGGSDGSPTKTNGSTFRFRSDDSPATADNTNPCVIPTSGFNYSYWVHIGLDISGTFTEVNNVRFYSDGTLGWTLGTSGQVRRGNRDSGDKGCPSANYKLATGTVGTTGAELGATHTYFSGQTTKTVSAFSDTSGSPATIDSSSHTSAEATKAVVLQAKIDTDATQGSQSAETFTILYDEI